MRRALRALSNAVIVLLLLGSAAFAATPQDTEPLTSDPVYLDEVHSPLEHSGTWTSLRTPWSEPQSKPAKPGAITPDSGVWWGGWYIDSVSNTILQNNARRDAAEAFKMLGRGVCMDTTETTSMSGTISISGTAKYSEAINGSFGFTGSGTKTFTKTYKYCGPSESSQYQYRYFYKQLIYNKYRSTVVRQYFRWNGLLDHIETGTATVFVPYMATYSQDSNR